MSMLLTGIAIGLAIQFSAVVVAAQLKVFPSLKSYVVDLTAGGGRPVSFSCQAPGKTTDKAQLEWFNNKGTQITATSVNSRVFITDAAGRLILRIIQPTMEDAGTYTCRGVVDGRKEEASRELIIYNGMDITSPTTQYAVQGRDARIWCRGTPTTLETHILWYRNVWTPLRFNDKYRQGYETAPGKEGAYLEIKDIQPEDGGNYICQIAVPFIGKTIARSINVIVKATAKITTPKPSNPVG